MICNACRYCEGYCPVFPAMERRRVFDTRDLVYLAYLCHDCRSCYYACMYTPPHEFNINIPSLLNKTRDIVYKSSKPETLGIFSRNPFAYVLLQLFVSFVLFIPIIVGINAIFDVLALIFFSLALLSLALLAYHIAEFYNLIFDTKTKKLSLKHIVVALYETLIHKWFYGGGDWCYFPSIKQGSPYRLLTHILIFYSILVILAIHVIPAYLSFYLPLPISFTSAFVTVSTSPYRDLNLVMGILLAIGSTLALLGRVLGARMQPDVVRNTYLDYALPIVLLSIALTGILTYLCRLYLPMLTFYVFLVHVSLVFVAISLLPYTKLIHLAYRFIALVKNALESD